MNIDHKCHFHRDFKITHFCSLKQCTLPLCSQCQSIHIQEHQDKHEQPNLISFNEAYRRSTTQIQEFLKQSRKDLRQQQKQIEQDRENAIKYIDEYYNKLKVAVKQVKGNYQNLEEKLNKLYRGSIKTLIFYYSGDIELKNQKIYFEPLMDKLKNQTNFSNAKQPAKAPQINIVKVNEVSAQKKYASIKSEQLKVDTHKVNKNQHDHTNIFNKIDQIKLGQKNKQRRSIFDHNQNVKKQEREESHPKQHSGKYSYNIHPTAENQEDRDRIQTTNFSYNPTNKPLQHKKNPSAGDFKNIHKEVSQQKEKEPQQPVSFENRYSNTNKFTASEQYEQYKKEREERGQQKYQYKIFDQKEIEKPNPKVLRASDLNIDTRKQEGVHNINFNPSPNYLAGQKMRSFSQNHITTHQMQEQRTQDKTYDMKKEVLAPEEIRKMLEKRMQERNRILTLKKNENFPVQRKQFESKNSIINQIYNDHKH